MAQKRCLAPAKTGQLVTAQNCTRTEILFPEHAIISFQRHRTMSRPPLGSRLRFLLHRDALMMLLFRLERHFAIRKAPSIFTTGRILQSVPLLITTVVALGF